jgi:nickel transport protein
LVLEGETNDKGEFKFARPQVDSALKVVLISGMGHQGEWILTREDLGLPPAGSTTAATGETKTEPAATTSPANIPTDTASANVNMQELTKMVTQVVAREVAPLKKMMIEQVEGGPSITEIFGGIGWLIGLAGMAAYMKYRK